ncbi:16S rRNA (uracil(1498)-N(3))-methyltransferase [Psychrobacter frigidicola]|uniref:Ribosomal RNA small subunit methyltransferase E n=1 Tax=Psychrobacter frigidicola TaxID=45611 RepID=A0A5C7A4T5_9GAMM|nr:16S rRNA (uracil(1498)-N(3))-methyltransferase [Psychrobacter frigidicola]TXD98272.1 16S rRNA (uracil(1498)-N(3))-methyltransferase [Psychrobacter frigidicola]
MNCILLPADHFSRPFAKISAISQIEHINKVLGAKVGDTLKIGELGGNLGSAVIDKMTADSIQLRDVQLDKLPPAKLDVTVILALPRPKVLRRLIMDMTALGVRDIILINSYRTQKSYWQSPLLARLDEFVLEGLQQGIDTIAPGISLQKRFKPFVEDELASLITHHAIVAHPYSEQSLLAYLRQLSLPSVSSLNEQPELATADGYSVKENPAVNTLETALPSVVCIGAEGGWIDYEIELFAAQGCQAVNIGTRVLRTEAAVNVVLGHWLLHSSF